MSKAAEKKSKSKNESIDDEELLNIAIKANDTCWHSTCDKSIKVIRLHCSLCNQFFCTSHVLPEIHGCGTAAKKAASAASMKRLPKEEERQKLQKKMSQKLDKMVKERKKKSK